MQHKKQAYQQIEQTIVWNVERGNTPNTLNWELEIAMLEEELKELRDASTEVDKLDAILDLKFVLNGTLGKMNLTTEQIVDGYEAVLTANKMKSTNKNAQGKITKPENFVGPEIELQKILNKRINIKGIYNA